MTSGQRSVVSVQKAMILAMGMAFAGSAWGSESSTQPARSVAPTSAMRGVQLQLGVPAPGWSVTGMDGKVVMLESLRGKPVVMQFGSLTEPVFRMHAAAMERLAGKFGEKATFVVVYQHEAHAADGSAAIEPNMNDGFQLPAPTSQQERLEMAKQAQDRLKLVKQQMLVDTWNNATSSRYGNYPNMTFVIDAKGNLQAGYPWSDVNKIQAAVGALVAGKDVPDGARGRVGTEAAASSADASAMYMQQMGGGQKLAVMLDQLNLSDDQKNTIYPVLTQFLADVRNFRERRNGANVPAAQKAAAAAASQPKPTTSDGTMDMSPDALQQEIQKMRDDAGKLKGAVNAALPADKAKEFIDAIDQGPARRLFND